VVVVVARQRRIQVAVVGHSELRKRKHQSRSRLS
jgi:hypothetical protein